ncbi:hypothetical protein ACFL35_01830, partial [Candidatus Riflebacteria bacterium]
SMTLIEILIVIMLMTSGIIPVFRLLSSGRKRIKRAEEKTLATIVAASAIELFRTSGYEEADKLKSSPDYRRIEHEAKENHLAIDYKVYRLGSKKAGANTLTGRPVPLKQVVVTVRDITKNKKDQKRDTILTTILVDPREALY